MKVLLKSAMAGLILVGSLSCSKQESNVDVELTMIGTTSFLIKAKAQSCTNVVAVFKNAEIARATEINEMYFNYQGATLTWKSTTDTAFIVSMDFDFDSTNVFTHSCTIAGDELQAVFYDFTGGTDWDGSLAPAASAATPTVKTSGSLCRLRCGGITLPNPDKPFTVAGTVTLRGFQRAPNGDEKPFKTTASVKLIHQ